VKAEYINPFIKASTEVLRQIANLEFKTGAPYLKMSPFGADNLIILVGITGEMRGQAVISMSIEMAKKVASSMMMGMPVDVIDEMAKSALSELGNMIMGNTATLLFNAGVNIDITPPTLMMGEKMQISSGGMKTIGVPLICDFGEITIDISVKE
jgi:chemotaxis protein CheX